MKRIICMLLAALLCVGLILPMMANAQIFVPSNGVDVRTAEINGEDIMTRIVITSVPEAEGGTDEISQEAREALLKAYDMLSNENMKLITEGSPKFMELLSVNVGKDDALREELKKEGVTLTATFELTVEEGLSIVALSYINGEWVPVVNIVDNMNGTVTCEVEDEGPVVFILVEPHTLEEKTVDQILIAEDVYNYTNKVEFVPSVTYKVGPTIVDVDTNIRTADVEWGGDGIDPCIVLTNVDQAKKKSTDVSQEDRDLLIEVYDLLSSGEMVLPLKEGYVVRELVDIGFKYEACQKQESHGDKDFNLSEEGITMTIVFDMDLEPEEEILVMTYVDGEWVSVESVQNNGDGTVTCVFEDVCPVAFIKEAPDGADHSATDNPFSGDAMAQTMGLWIGLMVVCVVGIVVLVVVMNRKRK